MQEHFVRVAPAERVHIVYANVFSALVIIYPIIRNASALHVLQFVRLQRQRALGIIYAVEIRIRIHRGVFRRSFRAHALGKLLCRVKYPLLPPVKIRLVVIVYAERAGNPSRKAVLLGMASEIYYKLGDYSKAVDYADRAYRLDSIGGREAKMAVRLSQKGTALVGLKKYAEAEQVLLKAISGLRASGNAHSLAIDLNQLGFLMLRQDREREAVGYFSQAASLFGKMGDLYNLVNSHKGLYESYWSINPDSARIELEHFNALRDSLYSTATADALARYKTEFDTDRLREEVEQIHSARLRDIVVGVCVLAVVVLAAVAIHRRRMCRYRAEMLALIRDVESLYGTPEPEKAPTEAAENSFERMVVDVVRQGLASGDDISVSAIASRLNLGEQTFRRRFVAETGKQPKTFVTAIQMEMAARLLASDTTVPVAEVARACGFDDASAFSHAFKKAYSCSPTQFRQKRA